MSKLYLTYTLTYTVRFVTMCRFRFDMSVKSQNFFKPNIFNQNIWLEVFLLKIYLPNICGSANYFKTQIIIQI